MVGITTPKKANIEFIKKSVEKQTEEFFEKHKVDISGKHVAIMGSGERFKGNCKILYPHACGCSEYDRNKCPFYERMKIEEHLTNEEGVIGQIFERKLTHKHRILDAEKEWVLKNNAVAVIMHDSPSSIREFDEFVKNDDLKDRILLFIRKKYYPFSHDNRGGPVTQKLIEYIFVQRGLVVPLEDGIEKNCEVVRKTLRWFINHREK